MELLILVKGNRRSAVSAVFTGFRIDLRVVQRAVALSPTSSWGSSDYIRFETIMHQYFRLLLPSFVLISTEFIVDYNFVNSTKKYSSYHFYFKKKSPSSLNAGCFFLFLRGSIWFGWYLNFVRTITLHYSVHNWSLSVLSSSWVGLSSRRRWYHHAPLILTLVKPSPPSIHPHTGRAAVVVVVVVVKGAA